MFYDLMLKNRTIRRFRQDVAPVTATLRSFIESARLCASAANLQRLRYFLITEEAEAVYSMIGLGGYLPPDKKPTAEQRPTAYIAILAPKDAEDFNLFIDIGIAAEAITLSAAESGIGGCMIRNFSKEKLSALINSEEYEPKLLIALGYADEEAEIVNIDNLHGIKYYKNENDVNKVPKRAVDELILGTK